jgi:hypothetical protein
MDTWSKQTQTKPILPATAGKIAPLFRMSFILMGPTYNGLIAPTRGSRSALLYLRYYDQYNIASDHQ